MQRHTAVALAQTSLIVVILLWFISVMVDCDSLLSRECDKAIWASWLDLWRLGWIKNYKELIAGLLAAGAAGLVIIAARMQLRAAEASARQARNETVLATLHELADKFGTAASMIKILAVRDHECEWMDDIEYPPSFVVEYPTIYRQCRIASLNIKRAFISINEARNRNKPFSAISDASYVVRYQSVNSFATAVVLRKLANQSMKLGDKIRPPTLLVSLIKQAGLGLASMKDMESHYDLSGIVIPAEQNGDDPAA